MSTGNNDHYILLQHQARATFSPGAPIDRESLFAGRREQLDQLISACFGKGQHAVLYGERGVGKTSMISILQDVLSRVNEGIRVHDPNSSAFVKVCSTTCSSVDNYTDIWKRALQNLTFNINKRMIGFTDRDGTEVLNFASTLLTKDEIKPGDVTLLLQNVNIGFVFIFDEFDQVSSPETKKAFADTIKGLSDALARATVVLVGIGDTIIDLVGAHESVERCIAQIHIPRMSDWERKELLDKTLSALSMSCTERAQMHIAELSQGLPQYIHLIGLESAVDALGKQCMEFNLDNVRCGIPKALGGSHVKHTLRDAYHNATRSAQTSAWFRHVLLSCALAKADEMGFFTPTSVKAPLRAIMNRDDIEVANFNQHLVKFTTEDRSEILERKGSVRNWRYRFRNPMIQPYVILRGLDDGLITEEQVAQMRLG